MTNTQLTVLAATARTATINSPTEANYHSRGVHLVVDVTVAPGTDTVTPKIQGFDQLSGKFYDILVGTALSATGTVVLKVYPGITATANASANDILPIGWRVVMTHSAATSFTYSVSANLVA